MDETAALTRTVAEQRRTIEALIIAAERRTAGEPDSAAIATWQRNLTLQRRVVERTNRVRAAERLLRSVIDSLDAGLCILAADGSIIDTNRVWEQMLSSPAGTDFFALGQTRSDGLSELLRDTATAVTEVLAGGAPEAGTEHLIQVGTEQRWWKAQVDPVRGHDAAQAVVTVTDVTARRDARETLLAAVSRSKALAGELSTEKAVLTGVISAIPHLTYWKDCDGRYHGHNAAFLAMRDIAPDAKLLGRTEQELGFTDELTGILLELEGQVLHSGRAVVDKHITIAGPGGATRTVLMSVLPQPDATGQVGGVIGIGADVTRVSELERQLNQTNRLEAIGQLAAGIAHEINTPIQFVSDNTRFVAQSLTELLALAALTGTESADVDFLVEEIPSALSDSLEGLERVAEIVRAMKDFSHPGQGRGAIDLNRAIESTVQVARNEWKYCAELDLCLSPDVALVPCYEGELKQVILNLIVNAAHAIQAHPRDDGGLGAIRITTTRFADRIEVSIQDDGIGMDPATQQRIFDPFFTTKEVGKGTGQGLSMAYASIVKKHGGALRVESAPGAGSTFTVVLPASTDAPMPSVG